MIKRTISFSNPAYLKTSNGQLIAELKESDETKILSIEDLGVVILDHPQITITHGLMMALAENNTALITCNQSHLPVALSLPFEGHTLQSRVTQAQVAASLPLKKNLWQQTVTAKIENQAGNLALQGGNAKALLIMAKQVRSGDPDNLEAQAAVIYWKTIFPEGFNFKRDPDGEPPNWLLNYGYTILRALVARSLVGSGLSPTLGIHHSNQYNAYCLADDIMEPYRPYVDKVVCRIIRTHGQFIGLSPEIKRELLGVPVIDVRIKAQSSPLMIAVQMTTASLAKCFEGKGKQILYPDFE